MGVLDEGVELCRSPAKTPGALTFLSDFFHFMDTGVQLPLETLHFLQALVAADPGLGLQPRVAGGW